MCFCSTGSEHSMAVLSYQYLDVIQQGTASDGHVIFAINGVLLLVFH